MVWVRRDGNNKICEYARHRADHLSEEIADDHPEVVAYLAGPVLTEDERAAKAVDKVNRFLFEIYFDLENRMRVREGRPTITRAQYRNGLIAAYKAMPG